METKWCFQAHLVMIKDLNVLCIRLKILPKSHYYITERLVRHVLIPKFERTRRVENTIFVLPKLTNFKNIDGFDNIDGGSLTEITDSDVMSSLLCQHAIIARGSLSIVLTALHDHYVWNIHLWWRRTFNWSNSCSLYITISLVSTNCAIFVLFYGLF